MPAVAVANCRIPYSTQRRLPCGPRIVSPRIKGSTSLVPKASSTSSSRSGSPHAGPPAPSFIPQPKGGVVARDRGGVDRSHSRPSSTSSTSSIPHLPSKSTSGGVTLRNSQQLTSSAASTGKNSNSVLDKFKFFNSKDKPSEKGGTCVSKRTSSSSGFSSARSERSDSSTSLCSEPNKPTGLTVDVTEISSSPASNSPKGATKNATVGKKPVAKGAPGNKNTFGRPAGKDQDSLRAPSSRNSTLQREKERTVERRSKANVADSTKDDTRTSSEKKGGAKSDSKSENVNTTIKADDQVESSEGAEESQGESLTATPSGPDTGVRQASGKPGSSLIPKTEKTSRNSGISSNSGSSQSAPVETSSPVTETAPAPLPGTPQSNMSSSIQMSSPGAGSGIPKPTAAVKGTSKPSKEESKKGMCPSQSSNNISCGNKDGSTGKNQAVRSSPMGNNANSPSPSPVKLSREDIYVSLHLSSPVSGSGPSDPHQKAQSESRTGSNLNKSSGDKCSERSSSREGSTTSNSVSIAMVSPIMSTNVISNCAKDKTSPTHPASPAICEDKSDAHNSCNNSKTFQEVDNCNVNIDSDKKTNSENGNIKDDESSTMEDGRFGERSNKMGNVQDAAPVLTRETSFSEEGDDVMVNIKPMQPITRASPYGYMRGLGGPLSSGNRNLAGRYHVSGLRLQNCDMVNNRLGLSQHVLSAAAHDSSRIYGIPMKRVMSGVGGLSVDVDYSSDVDPMDLAAGYLSDGDMLRSGRMEDIASGYMSEGGASLYARRINSSRIKEEITSHCGGKSDHSGRQKTINVLQDDSFDDSSSVSSGISDTIAEISTDDNLTGSSVSSENNVYGSLKRTAISSGSHHRDSSSKMAVVQADRCNDAGGGHPHSGSRKGSSGTDGYHGSSGGGKSSSHGKSVKKTDSSMQTESSAFHSMSSAAWKKYLQQQHEHHAKNSGAGGESRSHEKSSRSGDGESGRSSKEKKSVGSSSSSSSSSGKKSNSMANGMVDGKHSGDVPHKSKHKILVNKGDDGRMRTLNEVDNMATEKGSYRSGRSTSPKQSKGSCESLVVQNSHQSSRMDPRKNQSSRAAITAGANFGYMSKRPTSTSSVSSGGSGKNSGPKGSSKKCSMEKLSESSGKVLDNKDTFIESPASNESGSQGNRAGGHPQAMAQVSAVQRGSGGAGTCNQIAPGINGSPLANGNNKAGTLERKGKVKVCANTQTTIHDLYMTGAAAHSDSEYSSLGRKSTNKQYFMTSPTIGLRDRVYGNRSILNGSPTPMSDYATLSGFHSSPRDHSTGNGPRLSGPLRSTDSDNYVLLDHTGHGVVTSNASPYTWLRHSPNSGASIASAPSARSYSGGGLTEAESMESLSSNASSVHAQIQHARANSLTHARLMMHQREMSASPRLSRSNSIRSTKSEKLCPSMLQRSDDLTSGLSTSSSIPGGGFHGNGTTVHHASQPTSPTHATPSSQGGRYNLFPLSPVNPMAPSSTSGSHSGVRSSATMSHYMGGLLSKMATKEDDIHGSSLSLVSTTSSLYSTAEEKQQHEIRKLKRELEQANEKVATLTSQLTTNAHMVAAFEQSLSNMTSRLQHLTASAEQKDSELNELRSTIEALKKQSTEAGLAKMALQSMQAVQRSTGTAHLVRRHTFNTTKDSALQEHRMSRQLSTDSMSSVNSLSSACSGASGTSRKSGENGANQKTKKKKGWLRSSFSKAFSRSKKNKNGSVSDVEDLRQFQSDSSTPNSPLLGLSHHMNGNIPRQNIKVSHSSSALYEKDDESVPEIVRELRKQLREKDMVLTDIRLEALTSAHQLEGLKDTVNKMRSEMMNLKHDNERLQKMVSNKSLGSSQSSLPLRNSMENIEKRLSASDHSGSPSIDMYLNDAATDREGKRVTISVFLGCHGDYNKYVARPENMAEVFIGTVSVSGKTKWDLLDNVVKRAFKEYVLRVDPVSNLGLNAESVTSYHIGEIVRSKEAEIPELLPCGYLVGDNMQIRVTLKGTKHNAVDALVFETLLPKSIVQRYVSLLTEHRRIILCGPSGTGKTYLAQKLAEFLVLRSGKELTAGSVATFSVDHKSAKELRQYLSNVAEQCESSNASDLPTVIILDNLHHVGSLGEVFNGFLSAKYQKCPYIIGTMNQATCSTTNLQLHHNFRWVLCANHMEPVKGFLGRYLRRKLIEEEVRGRIRNSDLTKIVDWMPKAWQHLNKFLETHSSSDVTIGPRLFLSCPVDVASSQVWFTDLWNYSIVPYLMEAVREGLQLYGRRAPWEDPADWVLETYPWPPQSEGGEWPQLLRLRPEDVGYEGHPGPGLGSKNSHPAQSDVEADPLLNMLMRLQEAASYSSPHSNDSDSTSLDGHSGGLHTEDLITSGLESTL